VGSRGPSPYVPARGTWDHIGVAPENDWGTSTPVVASKGDPGSYVDDAQTFMNILHEMARVDSRNYKLTENRAQAWGLKGWGNQARRLGGKSSKQKKETPIAQRYQQSQALWVEKGVQSGVGQPSQMRKTLTGPLITIYKKFLRENHSIKNVKSLESLIVRRKPQRIDAKSGAAAPFKQMSDSTVKLLGEMMDEKTGYGSGLYGDPKRTSVGKGYTTKAQMRKYAKKFGTAAERANVMSMTTSELQAINVRTNSHFGHLFKALDKQTGASKPRATRGLAKLTQYRGSMPTVPTVNVPLEGHEQEVITIHDTPIAMPSLDTQQSDAGVTLQKTAASRTKNPPQKKFDQAAYLNSFFRKHYANIKPQKAVGLEQRKILVEARSHTKNPKLTWNELAMSKRDVQTGLAKHVLALNYLAPGYKMRPAPSREKAKRGGHSLEPVPQIRPRLAGSSRPERGDEKEQEPVRTSFELKREMFSAAPTIHEQRRSLVAQPSAVALTEHTSYTHLIEGDLAPVGRVHLVSLGPSTGDQHHQHFLTQMDADANMGAQNLRERSRRGPFRQSSGRSRVMNRSAHVAYRRRGHAIEITVRRGITDGEMETLIGKLSAHRMSTSKTDLYIITSSRKKFGALSRIDMEKLRDKIYRELGKRPTIGLLMQDVHGKGVLHKGYSHSMNFVEDNKALARLTV
jgi:hypothetical protein